VFICPFLTYATDILVPGRRYDGSRSRLLFQVWIKQPDGVEKNLVIVQHLQRAVKRGVVEAVADGYVEMLTENFRRL
jgi:hypothetical protein